MHYLGIILDKCLTYGAHLRSAAEKARNVTARLAQLMPNIGGPRQVRRKLIMSVATSVALYEAPIWHEAMSKKTDANLIDSAQRLALIRVTSAYRTTSKEAVGAIAGTPPLSLLARERSALWKK